MEISDSGEFRDKKLSQNVHYNPKIQKDNWSSFKQSQIHRNLTSQQMGISSLTSIIIQINWKF